MIPFSIQLHSAAIALPGRPSSLPPLDITLEKGHRRVLLGESGSGKSLLSRLLLGRLPGGSLAVSGHLRWQREKEKGSTDLSKIHGSRDIPGFPPLRRGPLRYLPQGGREHLVPSWSVQRHVEAIALGRRDVQRRAGELMEALGLPSPVMDSPASSLSEGMVRRVLLALTLATHPEGVVLDEPTAGLDPDSRSRVLDVMGDSRFWGDAGLLLATHDLPLAAAVGGDFIRIVNGCGVARASNLGGDGPFGDLWAATLHLGGGSS